ncbi:MAG: Ig-like domain-containing protein, partial [Deinococcota bacterium]
MKRFKFSLLLAALIAFLAACGSDDGGVTFGSLLVTVNGPDAANVSVSGPTTPGSQTVTDSSTFTNLVPGNYTVTGEASGFETSTENVVVVAGTTPASVTLSMPKIAQPAVSSVSLTPTSLDLEVGETGTVQASVTGNEDLGRNDMSVTYQSSNTDVATVSREGVVTAISSGAAVITATSDFDPSYFDTSRVIVTFRDNSQNQTDGVLGIGVSGNDGRVFDFVVTGPNGFNQTVSTSARTTLTVPAGSYTVTATETVEIDASLSYVATTAQQTATVTAGQLEEVAFSYARENPSAEAIIDTFVFVDAVDAQGLPYFTTPERNTSKRVELTASQTEEVFCVTFEAQDVDGNPVPNA